MKKSNEPIDTLCRRALRKDPVEAVAWLHGHPACFAHDELVARIKLIEEAGSLNIYVGDLAKDDYNQDRIAQLIVILPSTDKKLNKLLEVIHKTEFPGTDAVVVGRHFAAIEGPVLKAVSADD